VYALERHCFPCWIAIEQNDETMDNDKTVLLYPVPTI
jgi:hypothetical protein